MQNLELNRCIDEVGVALQYDPSSQESETALRTTINVCLDLYFPFFVLCLTCDFEFDMFFSSVLQGFMSQCHKLGAMLGCYRGHATDAHAPTPSRSQTILVAASSSRAGLFHVAE